MHIHTPIPPAALDPFDIPPLHLRLADLFEQITSDINLEQVAVLAMVGSPFRVL